MHKHFQQYAGKPGGKANQDSRQNQKLGAAQVLTYPKKKNFDNIELAKRVIDKSFLKTQKAND
ncbi:MAG: hypothetical protein IT249_18180 [Chitinophagaceae bacterium]|nr:hypothetical protein [Chitinophagaceae bacterium]